MFVSVKLRCSLRQDELDKIIEDNLKSIFLPVVSAYNSVECYGGIF